MVGGIGDLLAQIEGDKPSSGPASSLSQVNLIPKRKADDQLRREPVKTARAAGGATSSPTTSNRPLPRPAAPGPRAPPKPDADARYNGSRGPGPSTGPPGPSTALALAPAATPQKPPKRGSFAEIMARGQRAQATMGQVGKIQHKKVEKPVKKERDDQRKPDPRSAPRKSGAKPVSSSRATTSQNSRATTGPKAKKSPRAQDPEPEKKKVRKPPPTTGYSGTARPRTPGPSSRSSKPYTGGILLNPQLRSKRDREDEDDSLDEFVIEDEEDDYDGPPSGAGYGYRSGDESSDMEAGMSEIDEEEERAAYIARRDDLREEQMERQRKLEKEKRKRMG